MGILISAIGCCKNSNLRKPDAFDSHTYLAERGYEVERVLGSGSIGVVMLGKNI